MNATTPAQTTVHMREETLGLARPGNLVHSPRTLYSVTYAVFRLAHPIRDRVAGSCDQLPRRTAVSITKNRRVVAYKESWEIDSRNCRFGHPPFDMMVGIGMGRAGVHSRRVQMYKAFPRAILRLVQS